jgi:uncharacterized membrane protein YcaP (DUF421 family)
LGVLELLIRITVSFFGLLILTRIIGRKEISQMTFFNFVSAITIGALTANLVLNPQVKISYGFIALIGWSAFTILMAYLDIKSKKARVIIEGQPVIVVKNGKIMEDTLKQCRLSIDTLNAMLRQKNVFSLADVEYAIFETDGKISVMKKENKQFVTKSDINIQIGKQKIFPIPTAVVSDGVIELENLSKLNLEKNWLTHQLLQAGIQNTAEVFYAEVQPDGSLYIDKRNDMIH